MHIYARKKANSASSFLGWSPPTPRYAKSSNGRKRKKIGVQWKNRSLNKRSHQLLHFSASCIPFDQQGNYASSKRQKHKSWLLLAASHEFIFLEVTIYSLWLPSQNVLITGGTSHRHTHMHIDSHTHSYAKHETSALTARSRSTFALTCQKFKPSKLFMQGWH